MVKQLFLLVCTPRGCLRGCLGRERDTNLPMPLNEALLLWEPKLIWRLLVQHIGKSGISE